MPYKDLEKRREAQRRYAAARQNDPAHRARKLAGAKKYYAAHSAECRAYHRRWYWEGGGKEKQQATYLIRAGKDPNEVRLCALCDAPLPAGCRLAKKYCGKSCRQRAGTLMCTFGLTVAAFRAMWDAQHGKCAACDRPLTTLTDRNTHVDHCHETNTVRGLLHGVCNQALGMLAEDPKRLRRLADYAERHNQLRIREAA